MSFIVSSSGGASAVTRIYTTTLASDTASVDITAIPQTYTHLELVIYAAGTSYVRAVGVVAVPCSGANQPSYVTNGWLEEIAYGNDGTGGGSTPNGSRISTTLKCGVMPGGQSNPGPAQYLFGTTQTFLPNYSSATSSKGWMTRSHHAGNNNGSVNTSQYMHGAMHFSLTNSVQLGAIDRLYIYPDSGNFRTGSVFTLYGWS